MSVPFGTRIKLHNQEHITPAAGPGDRFARWVFLVAGVYGVLVVLPQYSLEARIARDFPPPITHPEYFYGFIGVALAWRVALRKDT